MGDNCSGQNKNHTLARFLLALTQTTNFEKVQQYFPVRGHAFLPCDRDFATIKRELKKLYDVETVRNLILQSIKPGKLAVKEINTSEILEFKNWWQTYYKKTVVSEESRPRHIPKDAKVRFGIIPTCAQLSRTGSAPTATTSSLP
ncbi:hypothetical protein J6590_070767 [Homalodisca vitripennis]|nr:hypothetical protein J6590_070767 [Homalodisca vitripennis]